MAFLPTKSERGGFSAFQSDKFPKISPPAVTSRTGFMLFNHFSSPELRTFGLMGSTFFYLKTGPTDIRRKYSITDFANIHNIMLLIKMFALIDGNQSFIAQNSMQIKYIGEKTKKYR